MGLFSKRGKSQDADKLPELPKMPRIAESQSENNYEPKPLDNNMQPGMNMENQGQNNTMPAEQQNNTGSLPAFPKSENANQLSMQVVKEAVKDETETEEESGYETSKYVPTPPNQAQNQMSEVDERDNYQGTPTPPSFPERNPQRREPVFVRIDKFQNAMKNFEEIRVKVEEIEQIITEIKEIRIKEDAEFSEWEKDVNMIKSRLNSIDQSLFKQLD